MLPSIPDPDPEPEPEPNSEPESGPVRSEFGIEFGIGVGTSGLLGPGVALGRPSPGEVRVEDLQ